MCWCEEDHAEYVQCFLRNGNCELRSWIPREFAVVGKVLRLFFSDWENGWEVISVGKKVMTGDDLDDVVDGGCRVVMGWRERDLMVRQVVARFDKR